MGGCCSHRGEHSCGLHNIFSTSTGPLDAGRISLREHRDHFAIHRELSTLGLGNLHISSVVTKMSGIMPEIFKLCKTELKTS